MPDRTKLLVHFRRLSGLFENAFRNGPDGLGTNIPEHSIFIHHSCSFYLAGCLAFLEGEGGAYSWDSTGVAVSDFDTFVSSYPTQPKASYSTRGINKANMSALAEIRNAVTHNNGDLAMNRNHGSLAMVQAANIPGVVLSGSRVTLEAFFLGFIRVASLAVRNYHDEY